MKHLGTKHDEQDFEIITHQKSVNVGEVQREAVSPPYHVVSHGHACVMEFLRRRAVQALIMVGECLGQPGLWDLAILGWRQNFGLHGHSCLFEYEFRKICGMATEEREVVEIWSRDLLPVPKRISRPNVFV